MRGSGQAFLVCAGDLAQKYLENFCHYTKKTHNYKNPKTK